MKNLLMPAGIVLCMLTAGFTPNPAAAGEYGHYSTQDWERSKTGIWTGKKEGKMHWYKIDKNAQVWWSADGTAWSAVEGGMWTDRDGRWFKIGDGKLWWTADGGKNFSEVPEWKWHSPDGNWYKFDAKWTLWVSK